MINNYANTSFKSRCPQIRDANWVCRTINHNLPHISATKHQARILNYLKHNRDIIKYDKTPRNLLEVYDILENVQINDNYKLEKKMADGVKNYLKNFAQKRFEISTNTKSNELDIILHSLENAKLGNCYENSIISELILKLNNINNACCASLYKGLQRMGENSWKDLDHAVCIFNRDGSNFTGEITKDTIIIDSWLGKADFAKNMENFYRNEFSQYFNLNFDEVFKYKKLNPLNISENKLSDLKNKYKFFIFTNTNRNFMKNK